MSLWCLRTVAPCMEYIDNGKCYPPPGPPSQVWFYNPKLVTCPKHFQQGGGKLSHFYYDPGADLLRAIIVYSTTYWPSWDVQRLDYDPATGEWVNREDVLARKVFVGIWGSAWTGKSTMGSFNKLYACMNTGTQIREVESFTLNPVAGGWTVDPYTWNPKSIFSAAVVNRIDNYLAGVSSWTLDCWKNIGTTPQRFAQLRLPNVLGYLAYESRNYCWIITKDGVICKADYQIPRWEMISKVQNPGLSATDFAIAFDTRRKQVVVFRSRPDGEDGTCQHQLEFYYPMVNPAQLTQPVPVTSLRAGKHVVLAAHLIGEAGEGVTPYTVNGELVEPAEGRLVTPFSGTEMSGRVCFQYQAPDEACEETLALETTVEETL
jgi:hypothetical protein